MSARLSFVPLAALALCATAAFAPAQASDRQFFDSIEGQWQGPGEIVAGKYKGTKLVCNLAGDSLTSKSEGISLDGNCRVGVFSQKMSATISRKGKTYTGKFLDGAKGEGLDVVSGRVERDNVVIGINRKALDGAMVARLTNPETMNITISVKVGETLVPVIGMTLKRDLDRIATGSVR